MDRSRSPSQRGHCPIRRLIPFIYSDDNKLIVQNQLLNRTVLPIL